MADALLKAWNAPAVVSSVEIDAASGKVIGQTNCKVDDVKTDGMIAWTQLDLALPMPIDKKDKAIALAVKASDVESAINQQILKVSGATASTYSLKIDGEKVAELTKDQLASGVNLAELDTPMFRQAKAVHALTLGHNNLHFLRWRTVQVPNERHGYPGLAKASRGSMRSKPTSSPSSARRQSRLLIGLNWCRSDAPLATYRSPGGAGRQPAAEVRQSSLMSGRSLRGSMPAHIDTGRRRRVRRL